MDHRSLPRTRAAIVVIGLGYGDESKGATVDFLAHHLADTAAVVRWSGGAQAAHNVVHGPRHHTFRQFSSATFLDVPTLLLAPMVVDPLALGVEAEQLADLGVIDPLELVTVDSRCLVTTRLHAAVNQAREGRRGVDRHGSCGMGVGETVGYALAAQGRAPGDLVGPLPPRGARPLRIGDLTSRSAIDERLAALHSWALPLLPEQHDLPTVADLADELEEIGAHLRIDRSGDEMVHRAVRAGSVIFEGSQGVLLDEYAGFHPHTTWATVVPGHPDGGPGDDAETAAGLARSSLRSRFSDARPYVLGVTRTYATRHGAGPFPTEDSSLRFDEPYNRCGPYQGAWRTGHLDLVTLRYAAAAAGGIDGVAVSHLDAVGAGLRVADGWTDGSGAAPSSLRAEDESSIAAAASRARLAVEAVPQYAPDVLGPDHLLNAIADAVGAPVVVTAHGPARSDRRLR